MLRNRRLNDCFEDLKDAMAAKDDRAIEKFAQMILDIEFNKKPESEESVRERAASLPMFLAIAELSQVLLKQGRYADITAALERALAIWTEIVTSNSTAKKHVMVVCKVVVEDINATIKDNPPSSVTREFTDLLSLLGAIQVGLDAIPVNTAGSGDVDLPGTATQCEPPIGTAGRMTEGADGKFHVDWGPRPVKSNGNQDQVVRAPRAESHRMQCARKGLDTLRRSETIRCEADQMLLDLVEFDLSWESAEDTGRLQDIHAAYEAFARHPQSQPAILAKFEQSALLHRQGLALLEQAPGYDPIEFRWWRRRLISLLVTIGKHQEAAELDEKTATL
jgi:tetratricopeptide (TPR) repeat protein